MYKILIVEDDLTIASILKNYLCKWGYEAEIISDFNNVMEDFIKYDPQLVILDITLPFYNGFHWCTEIRRISKVPIIFASSASDNMNLIMAINMGADDFIAKPFDLNVVVAKVQALIRRTYSFQGQTNILESNGAVLNLGDTTLTYNNKKIELSKNEFKILQILLENKNKTVPRDDIMRHLWNSDSFIDDNTLTVNVTRLRKKLEDIELKDFIKTKKGIGYIVGD
ncbi:response regulator transcription factor [Clostridium sp. CMCC3677]|uniref:response regulator transcription factor n=1 Tax=Clostridium sp. CMCC3677 TaxID=2949963 RepID=UPI0013F04B33|nr:response regulator transcription factor [Clostridium sp. CMCC3677]NFG62009.1 response regulator transcription factor [Clostridium botulinum]NFQ08323.1 response regulator transcription factor [Clostridium botulinum]